MMVHDFIFRRTTEAADLIRVVQGRWYAAARRGRQGPGTFDVFRHGTGWKVTVRARESEESELTKLLESFRDSKSADRAKDSGPSNQTTTASK